MAPKKTAIEEEKKVEQKAEKKEEKKDTKTSAPEADPKKADPAKVFASMQHNFDVSAKAFEESDM